MFLTPQFTQETKPIRVCKCNFPIASQVNTHKTSTNYSQQMANFRHYKCSKICWPHVRGKISNYTFHRSQARQLTDSVLGKRIFLQMSIATKLGRNSPNFMEYETSSQFSPRARLLFLTLGVLMGCVVCAQAQNNVCIIMVITAKDLVFCVSFSKSYF
jgi:hypothetical protein